MCIRDSVYNTFVNTMDDYIRNVSGKSIRIWGTFPPMANLTENVHKDVPIQHWEFVSVHPSEVPLAID